MTTTPETPAAVRALTIHRNVTAVEAMTVGASAALIDTGSEPIPIDARVVLEIVDSAGTVAAFVLAPEDVPAIRQQLDRAFQAAIELGNLHS